MWRSLNLKLLILFNQLFFIQYWHKFVNCNIKNEAIKQYDYTFNEIICISFVFWKFLCSFNVIHNRRWVLSLTLDTIWPCSIWPCSIWPCSIWPCSIWPCNIWPCSIWPCNICPCSIWPCSIWPCSVLYWLNRKYNEKCSPLLSSLNKIWHWKILLHLFQLWELIEIKKPHLFFCDEFVRNICIVFKSSNTEKCLVGFTIRWAIQLHDLVSYKATTYLVVVTISDSWNDLGNTTIWLVSLPIMGSYSYYSNLVKCTSVPFRVWVRLPGLLFVFRSNWPHYFVFISHWYDRYIYIYNYICISLLCI